MENFDLKQIRLNPHNKNRLLQIAMILDVSVQGMANYLLDKILDEATVHVKKFEASMDDNLKACIKDAIKTHYAINNTKKKRR